MYSRKEIIETLDEYRKKYVDANKQLDRFRQSKYSKEKNIAIFLNLHKNYNQKAIAILEETVNAIKQDRVDNSICLSLKTLFSSCRKENRDLDDTFNRIPYEKSVGYGEFHDLIVKLLDQARTLDNFEDMIDNIKSMIKDDKIMVANSSNVQIQQNTNNSSQNMQDIHENHATEQISDLITMIKGNYEQLSKDFSDKIDEVDENIKKLEENMDNKIVRNEVLKTLRNLCEGTTGSLIASGILNVLTKITF